MASRRMITKQGTLLHRWYLPSVRHIVSHGDESGKNVHSPSLSQPRCRLSNLIMSKYHNGSSLGSSGGFGALPGWSRSFPAFISFGSSLYRYVSSSAGEDSCNVDRLVDIADLVTDETLEVVTTQVPGINEVAVAAADSAFTVAALQYLIDGVQSMTGLNWWAAIALTTILVRGAALPFVIRTRKDSNNKLRLMRPRLLEMEDKFQASGPDAFPDFLKQVNALFKEHGYSYITPFKGPLIKGSIFIIFFLALSNMAEKVPSFKTGGALWFTDLTAPDTSLIFPVLASLSYWIDIEYNLQEFFKKINKLEDPIALGMKKYGRIFVRILASLIVPITMDFPKAHFCYWITSNLFSLSYALAIKHPAVISFLDLPGAPKSSASRSTQQSESSSDSVFQPHDSENEPKQSPESSNGADKRESSDAITKQRITYRQGELKGNKKKKL